MSAPNNVTRLESVNPTLQPDTYGLDFWESLEGQLVVVPSPIALGFPNRFGEFWVHGDWPVTGGNGRGGLTITFGINDLFEQRFVYFNLTKTGPDGIPDGNPEAILIGAPLDKSRNPQVTVGVGLSDITGVVTYQYVALSDFPRWCLITLCMQGLAFITSYLLRPLPSFPPQILLFLPRL